MTKIQITDIDLKTVTEEEVIYTFNAIAEAGLKGHRLSQNILKKCWQEKKWANIKEKLEVEGSCWYVWWCDGVNEFIRLNNYKIS